MYLAASDEIFIYDRGFSLQGSFKNQYLKHCHEICVEGASLFIASTGFDSVLEYDLNVGELCAVTACGSPPTGRRGGAYISVPVRVS